MSTMLRKIFTFSCLAILCSGCQSKRSGGSGLSWQDQKGEMDSEQASHSFEPAGKTYYSDLQIVIETTPEGNCDATQKITEGFDEKPKVKLNDDKTLEFLFGRESFRLFTVNINLKLLGFDTAEYNFSALDGVMPKRIPFEMRFKRKTGNILELNYFSEKFPMVLQGTPSYSFSADEKRGECILHHAINVFSENTGYYPEKPQP